MIVPVVNLLDPDFEPTDKQFDLLMKDFAETVRARDMWRGRRSVEPAADVRHPLNA
jgi:hypothetical protein